MPERLPHIYRTLGENFNERVLPSIIHETLKAVVAQYNASQLITQREVWSTYSLFISYLLLPPFQIIGHRSLSRFIVFIVYLHILYN